MRKFKTSHYTQMTKATGGIFILYSGTWQPVNKSISVVLGLPEMPPISGLLCLEFKVASMRYLFVTQLATVIR
jgi:hypothetical protein